MNARQEHMTNDKYRSYNLFCMKRREETPPAVIVIKSHFNLQNQEEENSHLLFLVDLTGKASETCEEVQKETELCHLQVCKFCHFWFVWLQTVNLQRDAKGDRTLSFESFAVFGLFGWHLASVNLQRCAKGDKTYSWAENY